MAHNAKAKNSARKSTQAGRATLWEICGIESAANVGGGGAGADGDG